MISRNYFFAQGKVSVNLDICINFRSYTVGE